MPLMVRGARMRVYNGKLDVNEFIICAYESEAMDKIGQIFVNEI